MSKGDILLSASQAEMLLDCATACISEYSTGGESLFEQKMLVNLILKKMERRPHYTQKGNLVIFGTDEDDD